MHPFYMQLEDFSGGKTEQNHQIIRIPPWAKKAQLGPSRGRRWQHHNLDNDGAKKAQADHKLRSGTKNTSLIEKLIDGFLGFLSFS